MTKTYITIVVLMKHEYIVHDINGNIVRKYTEFAPGMSTATVVEIYKPGIKKVSRMLSIPNISSRDPQWLKKVQEYDLNNNNKFYKIKNIKKRF